MDVYGWDGFKAYQTGAMAFVNLSTTYLLRWEGYRIGMGSEQGYGYAKGIIRLAGIHYVFITGLIDPKPVDRLVCLGLACCPFISSILSELFLF